VSKSSDSIELFLARALERRSGRLEPYWERLLHLLIVIVRIAVVAAILAALGAYFYHCITLQDGAIKTAETTDKAPEKTARSSGARANSVQANNVRYVWVQLMPDQDNTNTPGGRLVRTIGPEGGRCPTITQGGNSLQMYQRPPSAERPFRFCCANAC
jgi:hypothetical protein